MIIFRIIVAIIFFSKKNIFKLFTPLERKCNKLQFGIRISSIEVSKQKLHISNHAMSTTIITERNPSWSTTILLREETQEYFPLIIGIGAALLSRRASRNCRKRCLIIGIGAAFLSSFQKLREVAFSDGVANVSAIVDFFPFWSHDHLTGSKLF